MISERSPGLLVYCSWCVVVADGGVALLTGTMASRPVRHTQVNIPLQRGYNSSE